MLLSNCNSPEMLSCEPVVLVLMQTGKFLLEQLKGKKILCLYKSHLG